MEFHASAIGAHCGVEKTMHAIIRRYYWPGMKADITKWISQCDDCQKKRATIKEKTQYKPIEVSQPFELVGMDLVGKLKCSNNGNIYICVMVDYFTKWLEVYPLKSKKAEEVTACIMDFFYKYGAPKRILTDRGKEFVNKINQDLCSELGIARSLCAPYHPQTNGLVEKLNGTIQGALKKMVQDHPSDWEDYIKPTVFGLRTKKQITTKYSPYFLMYGREARYPSEIPDKWQITDENVNTLIRNEEVCSRMTNLKEVHGKVEVNIAQGQQRVRKRKLSKGEDDSFVVGDKVLRKNIRQEQRKGGKLEADLLGPFIIINIDGKSADLETPRGNTMEKINIDHLKKYVEPQPRIPAKWIPTTSTPPLAQQPSPSMCPGVPQSPTFSLSPQSDPLSSTLKSFNTIGFNPSIPVTPEELIADIWSGGRQGVLWSKVGPYKIFAADLQNLAPGREVESEVVNAFIHATIVRSQEESGKQLYLVDSFQMTAMWKGSFRGLNKLDPMAYDVLIGPVCDNRHWTLVVIYPKEKRSIYIDPFGETPAHITKCKDMTRAFMRHKCLHISRWTCGQISHSCQQDSTSCGAFVCKFAELIITGGKLDFHTDEAAIIQLRREIACRLVTDSENLSDLCRTCGNECQSPGRNKDEHDDWIQCSICSLWFHWICVGRPSLEHDFSCPACTL